MKYYLIGIKGSGMMSLAKILRDLGNIVCGVDDNEEYYTMDDIKGISIDAFDKIQYDRNFYYIIGNAYKNSKEFQVIKGLGYRYEYYPVFINTLFNNVNIAISGTHGKTTTTKFISDLLPDNSYLIGDGTGFGKKNSKYFTYEACEYRDNFLNYYPDVLVITNIDFDHADYFSDIDDVTKSFLELAEQSRMVIYNGDFKVSNKINVFNKISFGFSDENDVSCIYKVVNNRSKLYIKYYGEREIFDFPYFGDYMVYDFLAAYTVLRYFGYDNDYIKENLKNLKLPKRRLEDVRIDTNHFVLDYAHHPNEIISLHEGLLDNPLYKNLKLIAIFEPHTISRLQKFKYEYKNVLGLFDDCYVTEIFTSIRESAKDNLEDELINFLGYKKWKIDDSLLNLENTAFIFLGAGKIDKYCHEFINKFKT